MLRPYAISSLSDQGGGDEQSADALLAGLRSERHGQMVFPTLGAPSNGTFIAALLAASSRTQLGIDQEWNLKSKLSSVFWNGKRAIAERIR